MKAFVKIIMIIFLLFGMSFWASADVEMVVPPAVYEENPFGGRVLEEIECTCNEAGFWWNIWDLGIEESGGPVGAGERQYVTWSDTVEYDCKGPREGSWVDDWVLGKAYAEVDAPCLYFCGPGPCCRIEAKRVIYFGSDTWHECTEMSPAHRNVMSYLTGRLKDFGSGGGEGEVRGGESSLMGTPIGASGSASNASNEEILGVSTEEDEKKIISEKVERKDRNIAKDAASAKLSNRQAMNIPVHSLVIMIAIGSALGLLVGALKIHKERGRDK